MKKVLILACFTIILTCSSFALSLGDNSNPTKDEIIIPSIDSVISNGYPKNSRGQTYGPNIGLENPKNTFETPDLLLAENKDGIVGYIKSEDLNQTPQTIEEALELTKNPSTIELPMYLQDGVTVVGTFSLSPHT